MTERVVVIGGGFGGLAAAIELGARGYAVTLCEGASELGGKGGEQVVDGVGFDTGPSLLTLPEVLDGLLATAGARMADVVSLRRLDPASRCLWPDGTRIDVRADLADTLDEVRQALGPAAVDDLRGFLRQAESIWQASAPAFVFGDAPSLGGVMRMGPARWADLARIDATKTMQTVLEKRIRSPYLRDLLGRFATYNGSDVRRAPGTLHCIAHVELSMGGWGVEGGMYALVRALAQQAERLGVDVRLQAPVERVLIESGRVVGVRLAGSGEHLSARAVVSNAEVSELGARLAPGCAPAPSGERSTSGWTAVFRARCDPERAGHSVLFPASYLDEFKDLFDRRRVPRQPAIYVCDQSVAHGRLGWSGGEVPVFVMVNAPALEQGAEPVDAPWLEQHVRDRLGRAGLVSADAQLVWQRSPAGLAERFVGSQGSLYGLASNTMWAAFRRPGQRSPGVDGLYVAGGSAHPGGGVPLCLLSGRAAARAVMSDLGASPGN